jgi:hypothetical protein
MNVEIGAEAVLLPEKEYINGIAVAVYRVKPKVNNIKRMCHCQPWTSSKSQVKPSLLRDNSLKIQPM